MIKKYIIDPCHIIEALGTAPQAQEAVHHLDHLVRSMNTNGLLLIRHNWIDDVERVVNSQSSSVPEATALLELIKDTKDIRVDIGEHSIVPDCLIGDTSPWNGCQPSEENCCHLTEYFWHNVECKREEELTAKSFSGAKAEFESFIGCIAKCSKYFELKDQWFGRSAHNNPSRLTAFAEGLAYIIHLIRRGSLWKDSLRFTIYTAENSCLANGETERVLVDALKSSLRHIPRKCVTPDNSYANPDLDQIMTKIIFKTRHEQMRDIHDRFLITDHHIFSFGRGFDVLNDERLRADIVVFYVGRKKCLGQLLSHIHGN